MRSFNPSAPRERLARLGSEALSDAELIALLLGTGKRGEPVSVLAARLLHEWGGVRGLEALGVGALARLSGLGQSKASRLIAALELGRRVLSAPLPRGAPIRSSGDVAAALEPRLASARNEQFWAIPLDAKNRPTGEIQLAVGGLVACPVAPADVFRALLREAASGVVFAHNHPSGVPTPSPEDVSLTDRLWHAGELLGVRVVDHVIIARGGYFSFLDEGLLGGPE